MEVAKNPSELLKPDDLAKFFGVHKRTIANWVKEGKFPAPAKFGHRTLRWPKSVLDQYSANIQ